MGLELRILGTPVPATVNPEEVSTYEAVDADAPKAYDVGETDAAEWIEPVAGILHAVEIDLTKIPPGTTHLIVEVLE